MILSRHLKAAFIDAMAGELEDCAWALEEEAALRESGDETHDNQYDTAEALLAAARETRDCGYTARLVLFQLLIESRDEDPAALRNAAAEIRALERRVA